MEQAGRDGEREAGDAKLFDRWAAALFAYLYSQVANQQDAEDLLLDVFLAAQQNGMVFTLDEGQQLAWLRRVARNKVIDRYRHTALLTMLPLDEALDTEDEELTPTQYALRRESYEQLYRAIAQLEPEQRLLVRLRYGNGLRLVDIAVMLEKPPATLRKMLARTLSRLRALYESTAAGTETEREHRP